MEYRVTTTFRGKRKQVAFVCPTCRTDLQAPLEEAGQQFTCPTCGAASITPGARELEGIRLEEQARLKRHADEQKLQRDKTRIKRELREAAEAEKLRLKEARRAAAQAGRVPIPLAWRRSTRAARSRAAGERPPSRAR